MPVLINLAGNVWHLRPSTWDSRFQQVRDESLLGGSASVEAALASTIPATER